MTLSDVTGLTRVPKSVRQRLRHLPFVLWSCAFVLLTLAMARPRTERHGSRTTTEGIDIILAMDVSGSMLARDFEPDRITAAREVASRFIADRPDDRMGIVVFAGESFTQSPLTTDRSTLLTLMGQIRTGVVEDGTAIGNGLATAVNRLRESDARSKVVILLTDGVNNAGQIAPVTAADIAREYGIRVYTIGVGTMGIAPYPAYDIWGNLVFQPMKVEIDEQLLTDIAAATGGEYFRATDKESLQAVYDRIDGLEKSRIETDSYTQYAELYGRFALAALVLLLAGFLTDKLWLDPVP